VPPARSARHGACATMFGALPESVEFRIEWSSKGQAGTLIIIHSGNDRQGDRGIPYQERGGSSALTGAWAVVRFRARFMLPRSFWIFSCRSVMA
jgi:hypothetical protein